jgi:hypothetical protein
MFTEDGKNKEYIIKRIKGAEVMFNNKEATTLLEYS